MPVDAEGVRQAERDLPSRLGRDLGRLPERGLGLGPVEQVALEVDDARGADQLGIHLAAAELRADAQEGVMVRWPSGVTSTRQRPVGLAAQRPAAS